MARLADIYVSPSAGATEAPPCGKKHAHLVYGDYPATYTYDGLGRLTQVSNNPQVNASYVYNAIGNMTSKDGKTITYSSARPHTPTAFGTVALGHDDNGNRDVKGGASMHYDPEDHLTDYNGQVTFVYDYSGRKIFEQGPSGARYYFGDLAEHRSVNGYPVLTKHYFVGDTRIASRERLWSLPPPQSASAAPGVLLAGNPNALGVVLLIPRGLARGMGFAAAVLVFGLVVMPERRRRRVGGLLVHRGRIAVVAVVFLIAGAPLPVHVVILGATPAFAEGGGGPINLPSTPTWTPGPSPTPTRTATPVPPTLQVLHYHTDHLGSTQVITDGDGNLVQHIRYKAYGEIRGHWSAGLVSQTSRKRYEFTGYESEEDIGIDYARARFYDPDLGMFLTQDPARQFGNPYSYGGGNPVNGSDPSGGFFWIVALVIVVVASQAAATDAYVKTGSFGSAAEAGAVSLASSAAGQFHPVLQAAAPSTFGRFDGREWAIAQVPVVGSARGAARNFDNGNYASGAVGSAAAIYQAYSVYSSGDWSTPATALRSIANSVAAPFIGENFGEAWRSGIADVAAGRFGELGNSQFGVPESWTRMIRNVRSNVPPDAAANGMHAWHAGVNAQFTKSFGILGFPLQFVAGLIHETPLDWVSFDAEQGFQGSVNHFLDSSMDLIANHVGATLGQPTYGLSTEMVANIGNWIPGPGDPDPGFGGQGIYTGDPTVAWDSVR